MAVVVLTAVPVQAPPLAAPDLLVNVKKTPSTLLELSWLMDNPESILTRDAGLISLHVTSEVLVAKRSNDLRAIICAAFFSKAFLRIVLPPRIKVENWFTVD
jgi:hypothetical protein